jgi:hypothetical protein
VQHDYTYSSLTTTCICGISAAACDLHRSSLADVPHPQVQQLEQGFIIWEQYSDITDLTQRHG